MNHKYIVKIQHCKNVNPPIGSVGLGHVPFDIMFLTKQMDNLKLEVHENTTLKSAMQGPTFEIESTLESELLKNWRTVKNPNPDKYSRIRRTIYKCIIFLLNVAVTISSPEVNKKSVDQTDGPPRTWR